MPSSLEIAQNAVLRPISELAEEAGLLPDEIELYGRYKAKIDLSVLDRLAGRPDAKLVNVTAITPTKAGEGKTTTAVSLTQGLGQHRQAPGALPARGVARPGLRDQGRRGGRRLRAGRADGGHEPPLHRRHPRDRRGQQPARRDARGAHPARQRSSASTRSRSRGAAAWTSTTARCATSSSASAAARTATSAADRLRHHRRLRGDGDRRRRPRPPRPARAPRRDHRRLDLRGRARDRRAAARRRRDDRAAQGHDQAEPRADARGPARLRPLRPVREHRARQQLARRRPRRPQARRLRRSPRAASARTWGWRSSSTSCAGSAGSGRARSCSSRP